MSEPQSPPSIPGDQTEDSRPDSAQADASAPAQKKKKGWLSRLFGGGSTDGQDAPAVPPVDAGAEVPPEDTSLPDGSAEPEISPQIALDAPTPVEEAPLATDAPVDVEPQAPISEAAPEQDAEGESEADAAPVEDAPEDTQQPVVSAPVVEKKSWFQRLKDGLSRSSSKLTGGITDLFTKRKLDDEALEELEDLLIQADLGVKTAATLTQALAKGRFGKDITAEEVRSALAEEAARLLEPVAQPLVLDRDRKPHVILVVGVNGAGKTTTIGKMAKQFTDQGLQVSLAAGDTFRAAAVEQLKVWGERTHCPVIARDTGADAAGLAFDALKEATARGDDLLMIDTAGRLHNKGALMEELSKIRRVIQKLDPTAPHTTLLVLDSTVGQNAHQQVKVFGEMIDVTGLVMTKLDGTAKGGVVVALAQEFGLPVHYIGVGETAEDLRPFDAHDFARSLMGLN